MIKSFLHEHVKPTSRAMIPTRRWALRIRTRVGSHRPISRWPPLATSKVAWYVFPQRDRYNAQVPSGHEKVVGTGCMLPSMWPRNFNSFRLGIPLLIATDLPFLLGWLLTGTGHRNCTLRLDRAKSSPHLTPRLFHCYKAEGDWKKGLDETFDWLLCKTATRASLVVAYKNHKLGSGLNYRDLTWQHDTCSSYLEESLFSLDLLQNLYSLMNNAVWLQTLPLSRNKL